MVDLDVRIEGVDEAIEYLEGMELRSKNMRPVFWYAQEKLREAFAANFASSGAAVGGWSPRRSGGGWPLLVKRGDLMESLTTLTGTPNEINATSAEFGTDIPYAHFHQSGTWKMAQREVVFEPAGFADAVGDAAGDYIVLSGMFR